MICSLTEQKLEACPFKVGDRVRWKAEYTGNNSMWRIPCTVTEVKPSGSFKWKADYAVSMGARFGSFDSGECYHPECYELIPAEDAVVPRVEDKRVPLIDPQDVFQWRGDLAAFTAWFGEPMPIDVGEQISVPVYRSASGKWNGRWLRVWCGSWIVRREDGNGEGKRHYTFPDDEFRLFIQPNVGVAAPEEDSL